MMLPSMIILTNAFSFFKNISSIKNISIGICKVHATPSQESAKKSCILIDINTQWGGNLYTGRYVRSSDNMALASPSALNSARHL
ncbi:hypothetical protein CBM2609_P190005 [Cupriavidus taiwanensis]|uniref:Uncharacterized protein n=2 Tax=Cupriavidus TaxID=106589 RepID=A0A976AEE4_9BURK|nr:hypothetical protein CBM2585_P360003 [Cupriavidus taiwanensis]SOZ40661.1 hypothetical protein CBM2605_P360002 [Cupriavidus neocaledonicus]SOY76219.1 hypothetical protein CBM2588_P400003 [Cupriavidus taiwanensis]SOY78040.1 hypothetical protein CBM2586_P370003 [Cupriavidus taiwanensis]SOZ32754.1 hypothetical protein CBM2608_P370003 [Cupriavidus taiwanensis]